MIEILPESSGNIVGIRATEKVTAQDYEEIFIPALEKAISDHGDVRCLYYMDDNFDGWEIGAMWDDAKFGIAHGSKFVKIAAVGGPTWGEWIVKAAAHIIAGEVRTYSGNQLQEAWDWVKA
jgi:hypothetical protein